MAAARIEILRRTYSETPGRRTEQEPEPYYSTWCSFGSLYGKELYEALHINLEKTAVFEVRYCKKVKEITKDVKQYVVKYDGEIYDIFAWDFRKNERDKVLLKANRRD